MATAPGKALIVVREAQRISHLQTEVTVTDPELGPLQGAAVAERFGPMWVLTADNPYSVRVSAEANGRRHLEPLQRLADEGVEHLPAVGRSPAGDWSEESVAVQGIGERRVLELGRVLGQNAVFRLTTDAQWVLGCRGRWRRSRPYEVGWEPERYSEQTLQEVLPDQRGLIAAGSFWRFRQPGWRLDGPTGLPCDVCGGAVELASALLRSKVGDWYEAKAIICEQCEAVRLPSHLSADLREAVYAWSDWRLAAADAAEAPTKGGVRRCYIIRLHDPAGASLSPDREWVYVGETGKDIETRFLEHLEGYKASRVVRGHGVELRLDLMTDLPEHGSDVESKAYERYLALKLRLDGYGVKGGH